MSILETTVTFRNKHDEEERIKKKCNKDRLAGAIRRIRDTAYSSLTHEQKIEMIKRLTDECYW